MDGNQIEQQLTNNALHLNYNSPATTTIGVGGGNVGIGTASPVGQLHVNCPARDPIGVLFGATDGSFMRLVPSLTAGAWNPITREGDQGLIFCAGPVNSGALVIAPWSPSLSGIRITPDGNVGIGTSTPTNKLHVAGGATFSSGSAGANQTVSWTPGSASWSFTSDRNTKERISPVNAQAVLKRLARVPIAEWNFIGHEQRHIGPMAQDFHAAFPLNGDDKSLNDADLHGVALAAIQGLNAKLEAELRQRDAENAQLKHHFNEIVPRLLQTIERLNSEVQALKQDRNSR